MKFYQFEIRNDDSFEETVQNTDDSEETPQRHIGLSPRACSRRFREYLKASGENTYIFLSSASLDEGIKGAAVTKLDALSEAAVADLIGPCLGCKDDSPVAVSLAECTSGTLLKRLREAREKQYITGVHRLLNDFPPMFALYNSGEQCLWTRDKRYAERVAHTEMPDPAACGPERIACLSAMKPELERIGQGIAVAGIKGIPVHYILCSDSYEARARATGLLITALYTHSRIRLQRYCEISVSCLDADDLTPLEDIFEAYAGGTIVFRYNETVCRENNLADASEEVIAGIGKLIREYRNSVQVIFCFPRCAEKEKDRFFRYLNGISFVTLEDEGMTCREAQDYLVSKAAKSGCTEPATLLEAIQEGAQYGLNELDERFENWMTAYVKTVVYPQYADVLAVEEKALAAPPKGNAYEQLQRMIGLQSAKEVINGAINYHKTQKLLESRGIKSGRPTMHMVFSGNPGTAKTTVARLFAEIMRDNKVLPVGQMVEIGRGDVVGKYVGHTAPLVKEVFRKAQGGVLFIDEAYSLVDYREGSFGDECINTIVQEMENNRGSMVVIFAGYPDKMEKFLDKNPGLRSRIAFHVNFEDYSCEELCKISNLIARDRQLTLADGTEEKLAQIYKAAAGGADFGNGRFVRNLIEQAAMHQATRLMSGNIAALTDRELTTLTAEDFVYTPAQHQPERRQIGFCI